MDKIDRKVLEDITKAGWSDIGVFPTKGTPGLPFNYTVGLTKLEHPELIVMGIANEQAHGVLNGAVQQIKTGTKFEPNTYSDQVLTGEYQVAWVEVLDMYNDDFPMNMVRAVRMPDPSALQMVWPDQNNRFPWHEDYDEEFRGRQVLLGPWMGEENDG